MWLSAKFTANSCLPLQPSFPGHETLFLSRDYGHDHDLGLSFFALIKSNSNFTRY